MHVTIPSAVLRDVFGSDHPRQLLLLLTDADGPMRYSEARAALGLRPAEFQRALERLDKFSMVGYRAPADMRVARSKRKYVVHVEPTGIGRFYRQLWDRINRDYAALARRHRIPEIELAVAAGE